MSAPDKFMEIFAPFLVATMLGTTIIDSSEERKTDVRLDNSSLRELAELGRMSAETGCNHLEKKFRNLQNYFDKLSADAAEDEKRAVKNPDHAMTYDECMSIMRERQKNADSPAP